MARGKEGVPHHILIINIIIIIIINIYIALILFSAKRLTILQKGLTKK